MKVIEQGEIYEEHDGELSFSCKHVIYTDGRNVFLARTNDRLTDNNLDELHNNGTIILPEDIYPSFPSDGSISQASDLQHDTQYIKRASLLGYGPSSGEFIKNLVLEEARILEALKKSPHPNIIQYYGCKVEEKRIVGLVLARYKETLAERVKHKGLKSTNRSVILAGVRSGIDHLHQLGFIHNDINYTNIMFSENDDNPIIIDFDSCVKEGEIDKSCGTWGWSRDRTQGLPSVRENDLYAIERLRAFLDGEWDGHISNSAFWFLRVSQPQKPTKTRKNQRT